MNIRNISDVERHLQAQVQALTEQLELERNTVHALSEQLEGVRAAGKLALHVLERSTPHGATSMSDDHADASWLRHSAAKKALKAGGAA